MEAISFFAADIFIVFVVFLSFVIGWARGATKEILSVIAWIGAIYLTIAIFPHARDVAESYISHKLIAGFVTSCVLFVVFLTILSLLNYFCSNFVKRSLLNRVDKALGGAFGIFRGVVFVAIIDLVATQCVFNETPKWVENSKLRPTITNVSNFIILVLPESVQEKVLSRMSLIKKQSLLEFVKDDIVKNVTSAAQGKINTDIFNVDSQTKVTAKIDDEYQESPDQEEVIKESGDEKLIEIPEANKIDGEKTQTAEELATLKPKKKNNDSSKKQPQKIDKKERLDMDRILAQYDDVKE